MLVVRKVSFLQVVLAAVVVGFFIDHEGAALHPDGVAAFEDARHIRNVTGALKMAPREVLALIKDDLDMEVIMVLLLLSIDHATEHFDTKNYFTIDISHFIFLFLAMSCC